MIQEELARKQEESGALDEFCRDAFGAEEPLAECGSDFGVKPGTGKYIEVRASFFLGKMSGDGARFNKLDERVPCCYRIVVTEMGHEWLSVSFHLDNVPAQFPDESADFFS